MKELELAIAMLPAGVLEPLPGSAIDTGEINHVV